MHILFSDETHFFVVEVPSDLDDIASEIIRYLGSFDELHERTLVTYSLTPMFQVEGSQNLLTHIELYEFMANFEFMKDFTSPSKMTDEVIILEPQPNVDFWDGLPERLSAFLLTCWVEHWGEKMTVHAYRALHEKKWPKEPETVGGLRFEREELV